MGDERRFPKTMMHYLKMLIFFNIYLILLQSHKWDLCIVLYMTWPINNIWLHIFILHCVIYCGILQKWESIIFRIKYKLSLPKLQLYLYEKPKNTSNVKKFNFTLKKKALNIHCKIILQGFSAFFIACPFFSNNFHSASTFFKSYSKLATRAL